MVPSPFLMSKNAPTATPSIVANLGSKLQFCPYVETAGPSKSLFGWGEKPDTPWHDQTGILPGKSRLTANTSVRAIITTEVIQAMMLKVRLLR
jgi:hypothetical protein